LIASCHVDDTLLVGTKGSIEEFKTKLRRRFKLKELGLMVRHLGIRYDWRKDVNNEPYVMTTMPELIKEIIKITEEFLKKTLTERDTPAKPGEVLEATEDGETVEEKMYRTIVGKIMYLTHKLMMEGVNAAREMSKFFMKPQAQHWKAVEYFVGYLKKEQHDVKLTFRRPMKLRFMAVADSSYGTDKLRRRSISGAIYTVGGTITGWLCKAQTHTTLSTAEAEYAALASAGQELNFITNVIDEIDLA